MNDDERAVFVNLTNAVLANTAVTGETRDALISMPERVSVHHSPQPVNVTVTVPMVAVGWIAGVSSATTFMLMGLAWLVFHG